MWHDRGSPRRGLLFRESNPDGAAIFLSLVLGPKYVHAALKMAAAHGVMLERFGQPAATGRESPGCFVGAEPKEQLAVLQPEYVLQGGLLAKFLDYPLAGLHRKPPRWHILRRGGRDVRQ